MRRIDQTPALPGLLLAGIGALLMWIGRTLERASVGDFGDDSEE